VNSQNGLLLLHYNLQTHANVTYKGHLHEKISMHVAIFMSQLYTHCGTLCYFSAYVDMQVHQNCNQYCLQQIQQFPPVGKDIITSNSSLMWEITSSWSCRKDSH